MMLNTDILKSNFSDLEKYVLLTMKDYTNVFGDIVGFDTHEAASRVNLDFNEFNDAFRKFVDIKLVEVCEDGEYKSGEPHVVIKWINLGLLDTYNRDLSNLID